MIQISQSPTASATQQQVSQVLSKLSDMQAKIDRMARDIDDIYDFLKKGRRLQ